MTRRIRWQILIAAVSSLLVLGLMSYLALSTIVASQPLAGGEYIEGLTAPPQQLNPLLGDAARDPSGADIQSLIFDGLMRIGPDGGPEPALAQAMPAISANGTVYTFTLRTDVAWHDGSPLTADDVLFTLRAVQERGFAGDPSAGALWRGVLVEKVGEHSVRCTLSAPFAPFLSRATFPILPAHLLRGIPPEQWPITPFNRQPVGTGPYQLAELTGERALLTANPHYYDGRPFIDNIEFRFFKDSQTAVAALTRGEIMGLGFLSTGELGHSNMPRGIVRHELPLDSYTILTPNLRKGPLADLELRRALARGLDKDALIERALGGQAARLDTPILPGWEGANERVIWYLYDPQRAADELTALGWAPGSDGVRAKGGERLELELITDSAPDRVAAAQEIAQQWGAIGVRVVVQQLDGPAMAQRMDAHDFVLALHGWQRLGSDPDVYSLWHSSQAARGDNYAGLSDAQIDELLSNARQELEPVRRAGSYAAFQQRWVDLAPSITLYQPLFVYATERQLEGLGFSTTTLGQIPAEGGSSDIAGNYLLIGRESRFRNVRQWSIRSTREIKGVLRQR
ncbi:MAG: peptide ABC transporter substrate-binding protein [Roseiflexaceae bacterium]